MVIVLIAINSYKRNETKCKNIRTMFKSYLSWRYKLDISKVVSPSRGHMKFHMESMIHILNYMVKAIVYKKVLYTNALKRLKENLVYSCI